MKDSSFIRITKKIEYLGNKLPHPVYIFLFLLLITMLVSAVMGEMGVSLEYQAYDAQAGVVHKTLEITNLLSKEELKNFLVNLISAYQSNTVLIPTLMVGMALAVAEETGFFESLFKRLLWKTPAYIVTYVFSVVSICGNIASEAGQIMVAAIGAVLFRAMGRNPWIGIALGWAGGSAGFTANLMPATTDVLLSNITESFNTTGLYTPVHALSNYFFLAVATLTGAAVLTIITEKFTVVTYGDTPASERLASGMSEFGSQERRGLRWAGRGFLVFAAVVLVMTVPANGMLRNADGTLLPTSPLVKSIVQLICIAFLLVGLLYGYGAGKISSKKEIPKLIQAGVVRLTPTIVTLVPAMLFLYQFNRCGLATYISVKGEQLLESIHLTGVPLLIVFAFVCTFLNMFMTSGSTKWLIIAPIFVPMFANLGIHPAVTQLAYRIGESCTNNIAPVQPVLVIILGLLQDNWNKERNPEAPGMGTLLAGQIPYSIGLLFIFLLQFVLFYALNLPIGPGITMR